MRRTLATVTLALLVAFPFAGTMSAGEPSPSADPEAGTVAPSPDASAGSNPIASSAPAASPSVDPSAEPTAEPSSAGEDTPSSEPTAEPTAGSTGPAPTDAPDPDPTSPPTDDPATDESAPAASPSDAVDAPAAPAAAEDVPTDVAGRPVPDGRFIVLLEAGVDVQAVTSRGRAGSGVHAVRTFDRAMRGFVANLNGRQRAALLADPGVAAVVPDEVIQITAQTTPTGVARVGTKRSSTADIDGSDQRVDADVAIVDTGVSKHPDLNVVGGYNCASSDRSLWRDGNGHGTHVAGTVAALDNSTGVVGVAPGARIYGVRILNDEGYGLLSWYVCGLDWILKQRDREDPSRPLFEAVNMSVAKWGKDDRACGAENDDVLHAAVCRVVKGGITVVAAAANDSGSASRRVPAAYNEVITVSALADTDGKAGGLGGNRCYSWGTYDKDDTFANFSNYGHDVDIMAPGKCIWSTLPGSRYGYSSGTSMAAPAVTGAVALYKATRPTATPKEVKEALQYLGNRGWATSTDPDSTHEKLLDVSRIAKGGSFRFITASATAPIEETGGTTTIPVRLDRTSSHFERIRLSVVDAPDGWTASLSPTSLIGWTAEQTNLIVTVPAGIPHGTYTIRVQGTSLGRTAETDVTVAIDNDVPVARVAKVYPVVGGKIGLSGTAASKVDLKLTWDAATDASSEIVAYEVQRRAGDGAWSEGTVLGASARKTVVRGLALGTTYTFRLRARDAVGNWSTWVEWAPLRSTHVNDRSSSIDYTGTWARGVTTSATNSVRSTTTRGGARADYTFTGRTIAVVMPRSPKRGKVTIYLDGVAVKTVDTYAASGQARRVVFTKWWSSAGTHRIRVVAAGTSGRPMVSLDGFIVGK